MWFILLSRHEKSSKRTFADGHAERKDSSSIFTWIILLLIQRKDNIEI